GALAGANDGGTATAATRAIYAFMPDNGNGVPGYSGTTWPYALIEVGLTINPAITATLTTNAEGMLLVNGWPAYQYMGDESPDDVNGTFGPWNYFLPDGTLSQDACALEFECPELEANIGDTCDDLNPDTDTDTVTAACECLGTIIVEFDCPDLNANIGDTCDDENADTENDVVTADCECVGTIVYDCTALQANIGDPCDDA